MRGFKKSCEIRNPTSRRKIDPAQTMANVAYRNWPDVLNARKYS